MVGEAGGLRSLAGGVKFGYMLGWYVPEVKVHNIEGKIIKENERYERCVN